MMSRFSRDAEKEEGSGEDKEKNILEKTKEKIMNVEHKAENVLKPVADKLHVKPW